MLKIQVRRESTVPYDHLQEIHGVEEGKKKTKQSCGINPFVFKPAIPDPNILLLL